MARNFNELRAKMAPDLRSRSEAKALQDLADMKKAESPFAKYRGIGTPEIPSGKKGIVAWLRALRGR